LTDDDVQNALATAVRERIDKHISQSFSLSSFLAFIHSLSDKHF